jgi:cell division protein FtsB
MRFIPSTDNFGTGAMVQKNIGWYWIGLLVLLGVLAAYAQHYDLYGLYMGYRDGTREKEVLRSRLVEVEEEKSSLMKNIQGFDSDSLTIEKAIRSTTGHVREGEMVYHVELPE